MSTQKILIIEDERPLARALQLKLSHEGIESEIVFNGEDGLNALRSGYFDLVILDLIMPVMDGFQFLETMNSENLKTPVIVSSNLSQETDAKRARSLGAVDYFVKSNTPLADIVATIKNFLNKK